MKRKNPHSHRYGSFSARRAPPPPGAARATAVMAVLVGVAAAIGCGGGGGGEEPPGTSGSTSSGSEGGSNTTSQFFERLTQGSIDTVDVLLVIDNSRSMADKQAILATTIPDLVAGLANPPCVDMNDVPAAQQPASPLDACPIAGTTRVSPPVTDMHIGVISSSLGGHGADSCPDQENATCVSGTNTSNNDKGHLLSRSDPCGVGAGVPTYQGKGFLAWDPQQKLVPPGESTLAGLSSSLKDMVVGVGQIGCGYEATLESWYRFLVDPDPYESISVVNGVATPAGTDAALLKQRADFLRPGSALAIIMLSDENDCSLKEYGQFYLAAQLLSGNGTPLRMIRPRSECATNPNDPCCASCAKTPPGCPVDPTCVDANGKPQLLTAIEDPPSLRCFDQKRRFGVDFLNPIDRYTKGLTSAIVADRSGDLVPNPIFSDLDSSDGVSKVRRPGLVFLSAIVGVPWQDIARDKDDLTKGLKTSDEMQAKDATGASTWDVVLGDLAAHVPPTDPHMIESIDPRAGSNPITGDPIKPPSTPNPPDAAADPINGHEYTPSPNRDDLQYACIFPLPAPRDCLAPGLVACDCVNGANDSPLCEPTDPANPNTTRTLQARAKAYPGLRELAVLESLGPQGIPASICPKQLNDPSLADYGYRPAIRAVVDNINVARRGECFHRELTPDAKGEVPCRVLEARKVDPAAAVACNECKDAARQPAFPGLVEAAKLDPLAAQIGWNCFCEITQATDGDRLACQSDVSEPPINPSTNQPASGFCYIDATAAPPVGDPALVKNCPADEQRILRFVGEGSVKPGATSFLACSVP